MKLKLIILLFCSVAVFGGLLTACSGGGKQNSEKEETSVTQEDKDNVIEDKWD